MADARYPNFAGKHAGEALFTPADFIAYLRSVGAWEPREAPAGVVLCYQRSLHEHVLRAEGLAPPGREGALGMVPLPSTGGRIGLLGRFGIGAPGAAAALEELAAAGTSAFVSIGTAGSLQRDLAVGEVASAFAISDSLADLVWQPRFDSPAVEAGLVTLYEAALTALRADRGQPPDSKSAGTA